MFHSIHPDFTKLCKFSQRFKTMLDESVIISHTWSCLPNLPCTTRQRARGYNTGVMRLYRDDNCCYLPLGLENVSEEQWNNLQLTQKLSGTSSKKNVDDFYATFFNINHKSSFFPVSFNSLILAHCLPQFAQ